MSGSFSIWSYMQLVADYSALCVSLNMIQAILETADDKFTSESC